MNEFDPIVSLYFQSVSHTIGARPDLIYGRSTIPPRECRRLEIDGLQAQIALRAYPDYEKPKFLVAQTSERGHSPNAAVVTKVNTSGVFSLPAAFVRTRHLAPPIFIGPEHTGSYLSLPPHLRRKVGFLGWTGSSSLLIVPPGVLAARLAPVMGLDTRALARNMSDEARFHHADGSAPLVPDFTATQVIEAFPEAQLPPPEPLP